MAIWDTNNNWTFWHADLSQREYAEAAATAAQWPAVIVAAGYSIPIGLMLLSSHMQTVTAETSAEVYFGTNFLVASWGMFVFYRVRQGRFGQIPWLAAFVFFEGFKTLDGSISEGNLGGIFIYLITLVFTVDSLRGWWAIRRFDKSDKSE